MSISSPIEQIYQHWKQAGIKFVACEIPDMAGMGRSKIVPLEAWYASQGQLRMIGMMSTVDRAEYCAEILQNEMDEKAACSYILSFYK